VVGGLRRGGVHDGRDVALDQQLPVCRVSLRPHVQQIGDEQRAAQRVLHHHPPSSGRAKFSLVQLKFLLSQSDLFVLVFTLLGGDNGRMLGGVVV
jgi:hypothetical protein